jgi:hypothetical protein
MSAAPNPSRLSSAQGLLSGNSLLSFGWCQEGPLRFIVIQEVSGPEAE